MIVHISHSLTENIKVGTDDLLKYLTFGVLYCSIPESIRYEMPL